jgi:hypothetical protein
MELYCRNCAYTICFECTLGDCKGHDFAKFAELDRGREDMVTALSGITPQLQRLSESLKKRIKENDALLSCECLAVTRV